MSPRGERGWPAPPQLQPCPRPPLAGPRTTSPAWRGEASSALRGAQYGERVSGAGASAALRGSIGGDVQAAAPRGRPLPLSPSPLSSLRSHSLTISQPLQHAVTAHTFDGRKRMNPRDGATRRGSGRVWTGMEMADDPVSLSLASSTHSY